MAKGSSIIIANSKCVRLLLILITF